MRPIEDPTDLVVTEVEPRIVTQTPPKLVPREGDGLGAPATAHVFARHASCSAHLIEQGK